jgi:hypothetical protein
MRCAMFAFALCLIFLETIPSFKISRAVVPQYSVNQVKHKNHAVDAAMRTAVSGPSKVIVDPHVSNEMYQNHKDLLKMIGSSASWHTAEHLLLHVVVEKVVHTAQLLWPSSIFHRLKR